VIVRRPDLDPSFILGQALSGLTAAMFLFIVASGLSVVFGVLRVLNFAHGSFYMVGAYLAWQWTQWIGAATGSFWLAALASAACVALLGGLIERLFLRRLYGREDLYQLLLTYALVLILGDGARILWGTQQLAMPRPAGLSGSFEVWGAVVPHYNFFIIVLGPVIAVTCWLLLSRTGAGRMVRAAALDREMLSALGADVGRLYTGMFMAGSFLAGLGGALVTPVRSIVPGMDVEIIVEAFIVVVIGGLGSFWGTFLGAIVFGQVLAFGILVLPGFSIFAVFALMAIVLIVRPAGLLGKKPA
jgi:branched-subunit amino acid ABC-type transport system permease component